MTLLALAVQVARARLVPSRPVKVTLNGTRQVTVTTGASLLDALASAGVMLPSACGGGGTCGLCRVAVLEGGGPPTAVEAALLGRSDRAHGDRLACQLRVRQPLSVRVPDEIFGVHRWTCRVERARLLTPLIREITLALPEGERLEFRAGAFVQVTCPPYRVRLGELDAARESAGRWVALGIAQLEARATEPTTRAYSLANDPGTAGEAVLNVRLALPPPGAAGVPPGVVSSWLFSVAEGDAVSVQGPHGHFFVEDGDTEILFVGGGVGMAPLHAHVRDQLECRGARRRMSLWYGARSRADLYYVEELEQLARRHENFSAHVALSEPAPEDGWEGPTGFIHQVVRDAYLADHPAPEDCVYYICGPPMMMRAVLAMLDELGVPPDHVHFDDFGG